MATTPIPNMNPTGVIGSGYGNQPMAGQAGTGFSGTGGPGTMGFGNSMNANPTVPGQSGNTAANPFIAQASQQGGNPQQPTLSKNGSGVNSANNAYGQTSSQQYWTQDYLEKTFGGGMGSLIYQYLMSNGGYNSAVTGQAVAGQTNAMQQQTQLGANNLESSLSAMGVSGSSSEMGSALTGYENQATTQQNAITSQEYYNMWNQSQQNEANMMQFAATGTAKTLANKPNWEDYLSQGLGLIGSLATGAGGLMSGIGMMNIGSSMAGGGAVNYSGGGGGSEL